MKIVAILFFLNICYSNYFVTNFVTNTEIGKIDVEFIYFTNNNHIAIKQIINNSDIYTIYQVVYKEFERYFANDIDIIYRRRKHPLFQHVRYTSIFLVAEKAVKDFLISQNYPVRTRN